MEKFNKILIVTVLAVFFALGLIGAPSPAVAATTPSLGAADTFGIVSGTYTNTAAGTTINGDAGWTTGPAVTPAGGPFTGAGGLTATARTDTSTALTNLNSQACTFSFAAGAIDLAADTTHGPVGVYTPGVYCTTGAGAASIGTAGITLSGAGTYIFRVNGALTSVVNSTVTLADGASSCDTFWTPIAATTLGANTTFKGTIIDNANAITTGAGTAWIGRALSLGAGTVTTDTTTITRACSVAAVAEAAPAPTASSQSNAGTINVVKVVINDSGGSKTVADFPLFVNGMPVVSGVTNTFGGGQFYTVTETNDSNYTKTFSGDCRSEGFDGLVDLRRGDNKFCIVTNDDIGPAAAVVPPLIDVVKVPSPLALPAGPGPVKYTYTLSNIGTIPVTNIKMVGDTCSPIARISGDVNGDNKLDVSEKWVYTCSINLSKTQTNIVTTTGDANGITAVDIANATVVVGVPVVPPLIHVTKVPNPLTLSATGGAVTYTKRVTNPGTVALSNVRVTDDKCNPVNFISGDTDGDSRLDTTETWVYTCETNLTQTTVNTATASGEANGLTARDFAIATVVVAAPGLPNTGLFDGSSVWNVVMLAGILVVVVSAAVILRKKRII